MFEKSYSNGSKGAIEIKCDYFYNLWTKLNTVGRYLEPVPLSILFDVFFKEHFL